MVEEVPQDCACLGHPSQVVLGGPLPLLVGELGQQDCRDVGGAGLIWLVKDFLLQVLGREEGVDEGSVHQRSIVKEPLI